MAWRRHLPPTGRSEAIADTDIAPRDIPAAVEHMQVKLQGQKCFPMTACERILVACGPCATVPIRAFCAEGGGQRECRASDQELNTLSELFCLAPHSSGEKSTEKMSGRFAPKVPVQLDPPKDDPISLEDLAKANGKPP